VVRHTTASVVPALRHRRLIGDADEMSANDQIQATRHAVTRLSIDVRQPYDAFRRRYEETVPAWPEQRFEELVSTGASWDEVTAEAAAVAPLGLFTFWRLEQAPLMRLAGDGWDCTSYLIGNTIVAERMYRHDPRVMSVVPFHATISVGADDTTRFTVDQPSTHLLSFDHSAFAASAVKVDAKFAELLRILGAPVGPSLLPAG
jgi:hypothetical protein